MTVDLVDLLSGQEAVDAAKEDGFLGPDETDLPNDVDVRDRDGARYDVAVSGSYRDGARYEVAVSGSARVAVDDCPRGCEHVDGDVDAFLTGRAKALNGEHAIYDVTIAGGSVVGIAEICLP
ncbi:MAG: hypothetical protein ACRDUY_13560 [Nitriliruptorales bacterium]